MDRDLVRVASKAARAALDSWSPNDPDSVDRLAIAIGEAVAAALERHEEATARHTALTMAGLPDDDASALNWQV